MVTAPFPYPLWAVAGRDGVGKDTAANLFIVCHDLAPHALADALKLLVHRLFAVSKDALYGPSAGRAAPLPETATAAYWIDVGDRLATLEPFVEGLMIAAGVTAPNAFRRLLTTTLTLAEQPRPLTTRYLLREIGTTWGRGIHPDLWTNLLLATLHEIYVVQPPEEAPSGIVVTDVRFPNEARRLHEAGARIVWVDAETRVPPPAERHASEPCRADLAPCIRYNLDNNGSLEDLARHVADLVRSRLT